MGYRKAASIKVRNNNAGYLQTSVEGIDYEMEMNDDQKLISSA